MALKICLVAALSILAAPAAPAQTSFTVDLSERRQTIQGLGATATGTWIPAVVDLYTQPAFADRLREDLGISIIRIALPPEIQPAENLDAAALNLDSFDFTRFDPTANLIKTIHKADPSIKVILCIWSPPAWMKTNASTKNGGHLRPDRREHFAKFCAAACLGFEKTYGVPIHALSIQNEPHFVEPYDSCVYTPEELRDAVGPVAAAFKRWNVTTRLMGPEDVADEPRWMKFAAPIANAGTPSAISMLNIHGEPQDPRGAGAAWPRFAAVATKAKLPLWMTETSGEEPSWLAQNGKRAGLDLAVSIHNALTFGQCEAWVYWAITDPSPSQYALMSLGEPTPKYAAAKQYFRFIRPGAVRINVGPTTPANPGVLVGAFHHTGQRQVTFVLINRGTVGATVSMAVSAMPAGITSFQTFRSSATEGCIALAPTPATGTQVSLALTAQSVTTLVTTYP